MHLWIHVSINTRVLPWIVCRVLLPWTFPWTLPWLFPRLHPGPSLGCSLDCTLDPPLAVPWTAPWTLPWLIPGPSPGCSLDPSLDLHLALRAEFHHGCASCTTMGCKASCRMRRQRRQHAARRPSPGEITHGAGAYPGVGQDRAPLPHPTSYFSLECSMKLENVLLCVR